MSKGIMGIGLIVGALILLVILFSAFSFSGLRGETEVLNETREFLEYQVQIFNYTPITPLYPRVGADYLLKLYNFERRNFFLTMKVIPEPQDSCYFISGSNCNINDWNPTIKIIKDSIVTVVDATSCWNWWNDTNSGVQEERIDEHCPLVSFDIGSDEEEITFEFVPNGTNISLANPSWRIFIYSYSSAFAGKEQEYSESIVSIWGDIGELFNINIRAWRISYYLVIIIVLVLGMLVAIGGIPLLIKYAMKRVIS